MDHAGTRSGWRTYLLAYCLASYVLSMGVLFPVDAEASFGRILLAPLILPAWHFEPGRNGWHGAGYARDLRTSNGHAEKNSVPSAGL